MNFGGAPKQPAKVSSFTNFPLSKAGFGITPKENMDVDEEKPEGKQENEGQNNGVSASPPKKKHKVHTTVPVGFEVVPHAGQGNCLFTLYQTLAKFKVKAEDMAY